MQVHLNLHTGEKHLSRPIELTLPQRNDRCPTNGISPSDSWRRHRAEAPLSNLPHPLLAQALHRSPICGAAAECTL